MQPVNLYVLTLIQPLIPPPNGQAVPTIVIKLNEPSKLLPENFDRTSFEISSQLRKMPRFHDFAVWGSNMIPLICPSLEVHEELRKIIENTPPHILKEFMITL